jgi:hypothetical protein
MIFHILGNDLVIPLLGNLITAFITAVFPNSLGIYNLQDSED